MAMRRSFLLSLMTAGATLVGSVAPAAGQTPVPAPVAGEGMSLTDGLITDLNNIQLAPGETIISGPPELQALQGAHVPAQSIGGHAHSAACAPACYVPCEPGYYAVTDALYLQLTGGSGFTRAQGYAFDDYDWELAPRVTLGRRFDCVDGYEFSFVGLLDWEDTIFGTNQPTLFAPAVDLPANTFDIYNNAVAQFQRREASFDSFEFNRTYTGWDVVRMTLGLRTILYNEDYAYGAIDAGNNRALLTQGVDNFLVGPQVGVQMFYPLGRRVFNDTTLKGGVYLNFVDSDTRLFSNLANPPVAGASGDETELAGMFEFSTKFGVNLTDSVAATIGYEFWYLAGVAESASQLPSVFQRSTGINVDADDDLFIHGLSAGVHVVF